MPDPVQLRESTEIRLPAEALDGVRQELEQRFTLTIRTTDRRATIIGSPVEIKDASDFLARNGITVN